MTYPKDENGRRMYPALSQPGKLTPEEVARVERFLSVLTLGLFRILEPEPEMEIE